MRLPETLEDLQRRTGAGETFKYVFFWGHHQPRGTEVGKSCLSQWYPAPFAIDGVRYATAEHYMMAEKARLFSDLEALERILRSSSPREAKAIGREVRGFEERRWAEERFQVVVRGSWAKFAQNPQILEFLLATASRVLVEASPRDRIWGIGLASTDPRATSPIDWRGRNLLGFALMAARRRFLSAARSS